MAGRGRAGGAPVGPRRARPHRRRGRRPDLPVVFEWLDVPAQERRCADCGTAYVACGYKISWLYEMAYKALVRKVLRRRYCPGCDQVGLAIADLKLLDPQGRLAARLQCAESTFQRLRDVLRLTTEELPRGQRPGLTAKLSAEAAANRLQAIAADLLRFHQQLRQQAAQGLLADQPEAIVLSYLERYGEQLCGHPVVRDSAGRAQAFVERTNNAIEHYFAHAKQGLRRRMGRAHLGRDLEDQPAPSRFGGQSPASRLRACRLRHPRRIAPGPCRVGSTGSQRREPVTAQQPGYRTVAPNPGLGSRYQPALPLTQRSEMRPNPQVSNGILTR